MVKEKKSNNARTKMGKWLRRRKGTMQGPKWELVSEKKRNNTRTEMGKWLNRRKVTMQGPTWKSFE